MYKALAHPVRLHLLHLLLQEEACVCHLTCVMRRPQPYISQQLGILRDAGLVADRREGQIVYYRVVNPAMAGILALGATGVARARCGVRVAGGRDFSVAGLLLSEVQ